MRAAFMLIPFLALVLAGSAFAQAYRFPARDGSAEPRILDMRGATDIEAMEPLILDFQASNPSIAIAYENLNTNELHEGFLADAEAGLPGPDLMLSSSIDLQIKLVNDGYAARHEPSPGFDIPDWAVWRSEAFGFTAEPVVIAYDRLALAPDEVPRSRWQLAQLLRSNPDRFRGKVATYDAARSGVGYLFATQDSMQSPAVWEVARALEEAEAELVDTSSAVLKGIGEGRLILGYNLLGSYAKAVAAENDRIGIVLPEDYTLVMARTAFVPRNAAHPELGHLFLDYLLSERGQGVVAGAANLYALHGRATGPTTFAGLREAASGPLKAIRMGPGLLVHLDQIKRRLFLRQYQPSRGSAR